MSDRGSETALALTEMRTVLNRARSARDRITGPWGVIPADGEWRFDANGRNGVWVVMKPAHRDPDEADMVAVLDQFIQAASRWERTDRPRRSRSHD